MAGITALVNDIEVKLSSERTDTEIAEAAKTGAADGHQSIVRPDQNHSRPRLGEPGPGVCDLSRHKPA